MTVGPRWDVRLCLASHSGMTRAGLVGMSAWPTPLHPLTTRSSTSAATCSASTPPTPATPAPARASGRAAEYVAAKLAEVGLESELHESRARAGPAWSPASRAPTRRRGALLVHGHLDVVPADADRVVGAPVLRRDPRRLPVGPRRDRHEGLRRDGARRGARTGSATGVRPPRDLVLAFTADEEAGSDYGAHWLVDNHRRPVRGLHRGDRRGRRLLLHGQRRPAALPDRDGREGHRLAAAARHAAAPGTAR